MKEQVNTAAEVDVKNVGKQSAEEQTAVQLEIPEFHEETSESLFWNELEVIASTISKKIKTLEQLDHVVSTLASRTQKFAEAKGIELNEGAAISETFRPLATSGFPTSHQVIIPKIAEIFGVAALAAKDEEKKQIIILSGVPFNVKRMVAILRVALATYDALSARYIAGLTDTTEVKRQLRKEYTNEFAARVVNEIAVVLGIGSEKIAELLEKAVLDSEKPKREPKAPKAPKKQAKSPKAPKKQAKAPKATNDEPAEGGKVVYEDNELEVAPEVAADEPQAELQAEPQAETSDEPQVASPTDEEFE